AWDNSMESSQDPRSPLRRLKEKVQDVRARHAERRRPTGFGFVFADRIEYLDAAKWDAVTRGGSFFLRRDILRVVEQHGPDNIEPRYAMIFRDNDPVAVIAAQIVTVDGERLRRSPEAAKAAAQQ